METSNIKKGLMVVVSCSSFLVFLAIILALTSSWWMVKPDKLEEVSIPPSALVPVYLDPPALVLTDLSGTPVSVSDYSGQVVLVNNWGTWCDPCLAELPGLQEYYETHRGQGFTIVGIEAGSNIDEIMETVSKFGLTYPIWMDKNQAAVKAFQSNALPNSAVFDRDGMLVLKWSGPISVEMLEQYVTPLIERSNNYFKNRQ